MLLALCSALFGALEAISQETSYRGSLGLESRFYDYDGDSQTYDTQLSVKGTLVASAEKGPITAQLGLYFRDAFIDQDRDFFDLNDTNITYGKEDWSVSAGTHIYNWRVLEIFTAMDTLNARNYDNTDEVERIGLPSITFTREFESSFFQAIYIPNVVAPFFPQRHNRQGLKIPLQTPKFVTGDNESSDGSDLFQYIFHYKKSFSEIEFDIYYARKFDTFYPVIAIDIPSAPVSDLDDLKIRPYMFPLREVAFALQGNLGESIWKVEGAKINFDNHKVEFFIPPASATEITQEDHTRLAAGLERAFYFDNNHTGTLYLEYNHIFEVNEEEAAILGAFTRDAGLGYRHAINDFKRNELSFYIIHDTLAGNETVWSAGHEFFPFSAWKVATSITIVDAPKPDLSAPLDFIYGLKPIRDSDNILITLSRFF